MILFSLELQGQWSLRLSCPATVSHLSGPGKPQQPECRGSRAPDISWTLESSPLSRVVRTMQWWLRDARGFYIGKWRLCHVSPKTLLPPPHKHKHLSLGRPEVILRIRLYFYFSWNSSRRRNEWSQLIDKSAMYNHEFFFVFAGSSKFFDLLGCDRLTSHEHTAIHYC